MALGNDLIIGNESVSETEKEITINLTILKYVVGYCMCVCEVLLQLYAIVLPSIATKFTK